MFFLSNELILNCQQGYQARWMICPLAGTQKLTSLGVCRSYLVAVDGNSCVFYQSTESTLRWRNWLPVDVAANHICLSYSAKQLWRLLKGTVYQGVDANANCPVAQRWNSVDSGVASIGIVQLVATFHRFFKANYKTHKE